jgi:hypothetical protein
MNEMDYGTAYSVRAVTYESKMFMKLTTARFNQDYLGTNSLKLHCKQGLFMNIAIFFALL